MSVQRLKTADDLEAAFHEWNVELFRYVYARTREKQVAEDIVQDVFTKAWEKRATFNPKKASLRTWFYTVTINTLRDYFRSQKHRKNEPLPEDLVSDLDIKQETNVSAMTDYVLLNLKRLPERDQEIVTLRYVDGLSIQEVCDVLGLKASTAKVAIHRAMTKLRNFCNHKQ